LEIALPAAKGMVAHAQQNWQQAIAWFQPVLSRLSAIGGSHAQREMFGLVYADALQQAESTTVPSFSAKAQTVELNKASRQKLTAIYSHQSLSTRTGARAS
jgi:hypothetical protein